MALKLNNVVSDVNAQYPSISSVNFIEPDCTVTLRHNVKTLSPLAALAQADKAQIVPRHFEMETPSYQSL